MSRRERVTRTVFCVVALSSACRAVSAQNIESPVQVVEGLEPVLLEYGDHTVGAEINPVGDSDLYEFFGEAGDIVDFNLATLGNQELQIVVRDPENAVVANNWCGSSGCDFRTRLTVATRGVHHAQVIELHGDESGGYVLQLDRLPPILTGQQMDLQKLHYGAAGFRDEIRPWCDTDFFAFEGVGGTQVQFHIRVLDAWEPYIEIRGEDGTRHVQNWCGGSGCDFRQSFSVPADGTYFLSIAELHLDEVGAYDVNLQCVTGNCPPIIPAIYQIVDAGSNCVSVRLINNLPVRGGDLSIGYPSSVVGIGSITAGPGMPEAIADADIDATTGISLAGCAVEPPADPDDAPIDRGLTINWLDRDGGDVVIQPGRREILTICFDPADGTDNETCPELRFLECLGPAEGPVESIVTDSLGQSHDAETVDARLCLTVDTPFRRGDANGDGAFDVSDPIAILICEFLGRGCTRCPAASDANDDGTVDTSDAVYLLMWRYHEGAAPPAPFPGCGVDPTDPSPALCVEPACI